MGISRCAQNARLEHVRKRAVFSAQLSHQTGCCLKAYNTSMQSLFQLCVLWRNRDSAAGIYTKQNCDLLMCYKITQHNDDFLLFSDCTRRPILEDIATKYLRAILRSMHINISFRIESH